MNDWVYVCFSCIFSHRGYSALMEGTDGRIHVFCISTSIRRILAPCNQLASQPHAHVIDEISALVVTIRFGGYLMSFEHTLVMLRVAYYPGTPAPNRSISCSFLVLCLVIMRFWAMRSLVLVEDWNSPVSCPSPRYLSSMAEVWNRRLDVYCGWPLIMRSN